MDSGLVRVDGRGLRCDDVVAVARRGASVTLDRKALERALHRHDPSYRTSYIRMRAARPPVDVIVHGGELRLGSCGG